MTQSTNDKQNYKRHHEQLIKKELMKLLCIFIFLCVVIFIISNILQLSVHDENSVFLMMFLIFTPCALYFSDYFQLITEPDDETIQKEMKDLRAANPRFKRRI